MMWCVNAHACGRRVRALLPLVVLIVSIAAVLIGGVNACSASPPVVVKADRVYVGDGRIVENGIVLIQDGRIRAVGPKVGIPKDATVIEVEAGCITPGLIDANARIESADMIAPSRSVGPVCRTGPEDGTDTADVEGCDVDAGNLDAGANVDADV